MIVALTDLVHQTLCKVSIILVGANTVWVDRIKYSVKCKYYADRLYQITGGFLIGLN